ncbi:MAG TPA: D-2-hydroxyacid dehydrogenase [Candidatus Limnocylindria bacterium]|jgi:phosphoglycerate dehydrogenase-like enzyme|nr:D-2-hydroxyacid dehydrogenase [Candidatus Limnocylindria bacterium]
MASAQVLIASYLEPEHVERIRDSAPEAEVLYEPSLLPAPRYAADHYNTLQRSPNDERRWRELLARADVLFDFDHGHFEDLPTVAPRVRWVQATSAGIGQLLRRTGLDRTDIVFTTASGVHAVPLAEFAVFAMLYFTKQLPRLHQQQREHRWERFAGRELRGRTVAIIGLGNIGMEVARVSRALGLRVTGTRRGGAVTDAAVDVQRPRDELRELLADADYIVLAIPHTADTEGLIGAAELSAMRHGAVLVNVARGKVVDEPALIEALRSGQLGGAALDVFAQEPLPPESPLWDMPNVLVSPHSASTADSENAKLTDLFCENLRRYLASQPLLNVFDRARGY